MSRFKARRVIRISPASASPCRTVCRRGALQQLKKIGCNAWRTAHNPPSEALLDACDRLGMLVMDENRHLGDAYSHHSPKGTTANDLSDLATMIQRDRNHPSIIMWSMCNEEGLARLARRRGDFHRDDEGGASLRPHAPDHLCDERRLADANAAMPTSKTSSASTTTPTNTTPFTSAIRTRRCSAAKTPTKKPPAANMPTTPPPACAVPTTSATKAGWRSTTRPFMAGSFTWTGFDYKGEPNPYGWPDISNNTGLLDVCGFPKDKAYYFQSCWTDKPMVHLVPEHLELACQRGPERPRARLQQRQAGRAVPQRQKPGRQRRMPHDSSRRMASSLRARRVDGQGVARTAKPSRPMTCRPPALPLASS